MTQSRDCPDASLLRALVEDSLAPDEAWVAEHVTHCTCCAPRLDLARQEEALLRAALPVDAPSGLLAGITAAVNADAAATAPAAPTRRPRRAERRTRSSAPFVVGGLTLLALAGLAAWRSTTRPPRVRPTPAATATPRPATPTPTTTPTGTPSSVPRAPVPTPSASPASPSPDVVVERPPTPTPIPRPSPTVTASPAPTPSATATPTPGPRPTSGVLAAAGRLRAGKLRHGTTTLAAGDAIPAGVELSASTGAVEVDLTDRAALLFDRRARFTLRPPTPATALRVALARGKLYARTTGRAAYVVETADAVLRPIGTAFLVERTHDRTHLATVDGVVRLSAPPDTLHVRAGFVAVARAGRRLAAPRPWSKPARALAWLPKRARPAALPQPGRVLRRFEFEQGLAGWGKGQLAQGGARGSRASLRGVRDTGDYATVVEFEDTTRGVVTIDPDLWVEVTCRVDRRTTVVLQLWNADRRENLAHFVTLEPNRWTPIAVPLRRFTDARGKPRTTPLQRGDRGTCFNVYAGKAGQAVTLRVDDVRFVAPR